jgi:hypothetical protein
MIELGQQHIAYWRSGVEKFLVWQVSFNIFTMLIVEESRISTKASEQEASPQQNHCSLARALTQIRRILRYSSNCFGDV